MRKAIIDIGTNTFNMLIAEFESEKKFKIIHETKLPVKLGKGSMNDGILKPEAIERGVTALKQHVETARKYHAEVIHAFATSAVRSAENKDEFLKTVKKETGLHIMVISGDREAQLIYQGVRMAVPMKEGIVYLILDIGGGSNEFILCDCEKILWKKSYNLGIARLLEHLNPNDPLTQRDLENLKNYTHQLIPDLVDHCEKYKPTVLLGASGSFETYVSMVLHKKYGSASRIKEKTGYEIQMIDFLKLHDQLIRSTAVERSKMPGLPEWRIEMIVMAIAFTKYIIDLFDLRKIYFSDYALKEGVVGEV